MHATDLGGVQVLKNDDLYLMSDDFGDVHQDSRGLGLYAGDTRFVSCLTVRVNGSRPTLLRTELGGRDRGVIQMTNSDYMRDQRDKTDPVLALARRSFGITRERSITNSLRERLAIANYTQHEQHVRIELAVDVDDADIFEVRGTHRPERGRNRPILVRDDGRATFTYDGLDGTTRRTYLRATVPDAIDEAGADSDGAVILRWERDVEAGGDTELEWQVWTGMATSGDGMAGPGNTRPAAGTAPLTGATPFTDAAPFPEPPADPEPAAAAAEAEHPTELASDNELFDLVIGRSLDDLRLLSTDGPNAGERYVAAGVPWYTTLFGRDSLITALQTLAFRPQIARDALAVLAARQARTVDDWRDAQPGKILHELRTGEMARAGELPHTPYYGSVDATPLWLILLGATYDWTGDKALVDRFWPNALAALKWIDEYGTTADGFVTYERRSPRGLINQGWKDSSDAIRDRLGAIVEPPIALAEVQGYAYAAKRQMSKLAVMRGDSGLAARLERESEELRARFEAAFWSEEDGYYAMAIGRDGRRADALASNAGQALWSGIVDPAHATQVAARLTSPSLDSGWGIRTYGSGQPGYNPIGYHTGSVWPHDNALIIDGLKQYGFHDAANRLAGGIFEAAQKFDGYRIPELFCGFARGEADQPVPYPVACSPQAWAASAPLSFMCSMLGLRARADHGELELRRPHLPPWLGKVTIHNLRVGEASVDLLFHSWRGATSAEVLRKQGDLEVTIRM